MKLYRLLGIMSLGLLLCIGCSEDRLTAEVPEVSAVQSKGDLQFVFPGYENNISHRLEGEEMVFELRQGKNCTDDVQAGFDTEEETLEMLTDKYAEFKGVNLYSLLDKSCYTLPETVSMTKDQEKVSVQIRFHDIPEGTFVLPLALKTSAGEIGVQFVEIVKSVSPEIDMTWLERTPTVAEPRMVAIIEAAENDLRNVGNYMLYPNGTGNSDNKRPLFDMAVIFSANMNFDDFSGKPVLFYNNDVRRILENRDIFIKPLQDKGIKVLLSIMPNHQGIGFSNMDISGDRSMVKDFAGDISEAVGRYGLDGVMFDDEYADYPETPENVQPGRPMIQMGSFHFLIKELRELMPFVEGQQWKDRHNIIAMYNVGYYSNGMTGDRGWCLFYNDFDMIKKGEKKWADEDQYGNKIREDRKAIREWVRNPENQSILDELSQIKVGELLDFVWNANYLRADNHDNSSEGYAPNGLSWVAGFDNEIAKQKYGRASFEMSLEKGDYGALQHMTQYWATSDWEAGIVGRTESRSRSLQDQKASGQTSMIMFNLQYVPDKWNGQPFYNLYLLDFVEFFNGLGNTNNPQVVFEGTNYDTMTPSYMK